MQSTEWAMTAIRSSLVPNAVLLMSLRAEKCILVVKQHRQKPSVKPDPAIYDQVRTSYFWEVHECSLHIQTKSGYQLLWQYDRFSPKL